MLTFSINISHTTLEYRYVRYRDTEKYRIFRSKANRKVTPDGEMIHFIRLGGGRGNNNKQV